MESPQIQQTDEMAEGLPPYPPPGHEARRASLIYAEDPIQERSAVIEKEAADDESKAARVFSAEGQFPEGGLRAWTVVIGSFSALFMVSRASCIAYKLPRATSRFSRPASKTDT